MAAYSRTVSVIPRYTGGGYGQAISALRQSSDQERKDIQSRYGSMAAAGRQQAISSGLAIGSAMPSMQMGYARQMENALGSVNDRMNSGLAQLYGQQAQAGQSAWLAQLQASMDAQRLGLQYAQMNRQGQNRYPTMRRQNGFEMANSSVVNPGSSGSYLSQYRRYA
jgi:hypothetical protein